MDYFKYNLPGLWFQIYRQVLEQNNNLNNDRLDKVQLRKVTTSIFIASTSRGLVRPYSYTKFQVNLLEMTKSVFRESQRKAVTLAVKSVLNGKTQEKEVTSDRAGVGQNI